MKDHLPIPPDESPAVKPRRRMVQTRVMSWPRGTIVTSRVVPGLLAWVLLTPCVRAEEAPSAPAPTDPSASASGPRLTWDRVCRIGVHDDQVLLIQSQLTSEDFERIDNAGGDEEIVGLEGLTSLSMSRGRLTIQNTQVTGDRRASTRIYLSSSHMTLNLSVNNAGRNRTIEIEQAGWSPRRHSLDPGEVRVTASGDDVPGGHVSLSYPNFGMLYRGRPHETNRYLRPLLRQLNVDLIGPTEDEIRQVLKLSPRGQNGAPGDTKAGETAPAQIRQLVAHLGDDSRQNRTAAADLLIGLGPTALPSLRRLDRTGLTPEQNLGVDLLLASEHAVAMPVLPVRAQRLRYDVHFLLNCLYSEDELSRAAAVERLAQVTGKRVPENSALFDPTSDWDARASAIEKLRDDWMPEVSE